MEQIIYGFIYTATHKETRRVYIGQSTKTLHDVIYRHKRCSSKETSNHFHRSIQKYGLDEFEWNVVCRCADKQELNDCEQFFIETWKTMEHDFGFNTKEGGLNGSFTEEVRIKMRNAKLGKKRGPSPLKGRKLSDEHKKKISAINRGRKLSKEACEKISTGLKGKKRGPHSEEIRQKISKANTGKKRSKEICENISRSLKGKPLSIELRKKLSAAKMGEKNNRYGVKLSEETKRKMSEAAKRRKPRKGFKHSEEAKQKMRIAAQKREELKRLSRQREAELFSKR